VSYTIAGHPPPIRLGADGRAHLLDGGRRTLLGMSPGPIRAGAATATFEPGDTLVLYSDGLVDRRDAPIDDAIARLLDAAGRHGHLPPDDLCGALLDDLLGGDAVDDDVALLAVRRTALA
jgi:serine phosphatase RsbU (regulator of sigma subunit)